jgi:hypothetical protein
VAFETIRGESGVDFVGTAGVDALFALNETGSITAEGLAGNDAINIANSSGVVGTTTVKGGEGNDTISFQDANAADVSRLLNSSVNGGAGDDTISTEGAESTVIRGNEDDDNFNLAGNYSNSTVNGNVGEDSFTVTASLILSNTKLLGGDSNDGLMNFSGGTGIGAAVNSTINGSKGNDNITLGAVSSVAGFTVFGGQGNDVITSLTARDGIVYSGDLGDDQITTGSEKDSVLGGEGDDIITTGADNDTIDAGIGTDRVTDAAGNDTTALGEGNDTYVDGAGDDSITGGAGADTYTLNSTEGDNNNYIIGAVADSAATTSGTSRGFDTLGSGFTAATQHIDITSVAESLLGDAVGGSTTVATGRASATVAAGVTARFSQATGVVDSGVDATAFTAGTVLSNVAQIDGITVTDANRVALQAAVTAVTAANMVTGLLVALENDDVVYFDGNSNFIASTRVGAAGDFDNAAVAVPVGDLFETNTATRFVDAGELAGATAANGLSYNGAGTRVASETKIAASAVTAFTNADNVDSFADLRAALAGGDILTASGGAGGNISANVITITDNSAANINGTYVIVNNTNSILDSGDLMFRVSGPGASTTGTEAVNLAAEINQYGVFSSTETASAWII